MNGIASISLTSVVLVLLDYHMRLNFRGTKLLQIANLLNIRGFYFRRCWERIDMVYHLVPGKLRN